MSENSRTGSTTPVESEQPELDRDVDRYHEFIHSTPALKDINDLSVLEKNAQRCISTSSALSSDSTLIVSETVSETGTPGFSW